MTKIKSERAFLETMHHIPGGVGGGTKIRLKPTEGFTLPVPMHDAAS